MRSKHEKEEYDTATPIVHLAFLPLPVVLPNIVHVHVRTSTCMSRFKIKMKKHKS